MQSLVTGRSAAMLHSKTQLRSQAFPMARAFVDPSSMNDQLLLSEVIGAFSYALDLTEGQPPGHCLRSCWIGVHVGKELGLDQSTLWDLYYTLLLKDAGCSSNAARMCELYGGDELIVKREFTKLNSDNLMEVVNFLLKHTGMGRGMRERIQLIANLAKNGKKLAAELVTTRCERGAAIARQLGFNETVAAGIHCMGEYWNGKGRPTGMGGEDIPLGSRVALLSQVADVFHSIGGPDRAKQEVRTHHGTWLDPKLVEAFEAAAARREFWHGLAADDVEVRVRDLEPESRAIVLDEDQLDAIATAFAQVVDSKSPYTYGHSTRVAHFAEAVAEELGLPPVRRRWLCRGALLHDIGKLGVSNSILDKPGSLTEEEWEQMRAHPRHTEEILARLHPFAELALVAGAHHERLDGTGYPKRISAAEIKMETRVITISDIFDAITADRPYRKAMPLGQALEIMQKMRGTAIDPDCLEALHACLPKLIASSQIAQ